MNTQLRIDASGDLSRTSMDAVQGGLIIWVGFVSAIVYLPMQIYTCLKWRGRWQIAASVPLLLMVPVFAITVIALAERGNIWPIFLILASPFGTTYLIILFAIRRFANTPS